MGSLGMYQLKTCYKFGFVELVVLIFDLVFKVMLMFLFTYLKYHFIL